MSYSSRDSQRSKVYAAEVVLQYGGEPVGSLAAAQRTADKLLNGKRLRARFPATATPVQIVGGAVTRGTYWPTDHRVMLRSDGTTDDYTLLHELAHHLTRTADEAHGWEFCAALLWLVRHRYGVAAHDELRAAFRARRVRYTPPRARRPLTAEQRAAAAARLAAARERRAAEQSAERGCWVIEMQPPDEVSPGVRPRTQWVVWRDGQVYATAGSPDHRSVSTWTLRSSAQRHVDAVNGDEGGRLRVVARADARARFDAELDEQRAVAP